MVETIFYGMRIEIPIDKAGRLVLPKKVRARLNLSAGDVMEVEVQASQVLLRPKRAASARVVRIGSRAVWDAPGAKPTVDDIDEAIRRSRGDRDRRATGM